MLTPTADREVSLRSGPMAIDPRGTGWRSSSACWSAGRWRPPSRSTSGSRSRSRSRSSRPTRSRRPRTRPRRSSSSPRSAPSSLALGLDTLVPIAIAVAILLAIVVTSYRQTIFAYPSGGGSYIVSRENLGEIPSLVAGASLLVDYILTVAVSISAGVAAIVSIPAFHGLATHRVELGARAHRLHHPRQPPRASRSRGGCSRSPTYIYIVTLAALVVYRPRPELLRRHRPGPVRPGGASRARARRAGRSGSSSSSRASRRARSR